MRTPAAYNRAARRSATTRRVACSRPGRVRNIPAAAEPNLPTARWRNSAWVSAAAANVGGTPVARSADAATSGSPPARSAAAVSATDPSGVRSAAS
ncbi:hypothetical protein ONO86_02894 [Micromonospora noduli]|nr:hypothetical protein ONO86_02894 [Micromonospora noduli]